MGIIVMIRAALFCPHCGRRHIDKGEFRNKAHRTHLCEYCGEEWDVVVVGRGGKA